MKRLKQALSLSLALILSLAMAVPSFAARVDEGDLVLTDVTSQSEFDAGEIGELPFYTVPVGSSMLIKLFDDEYAPDQGDLELRISQVVEGTLDDVPGTEERLITATVTKAQPFELVWNEEYAGRTWFVSPYLQRSNFFLVKVEGNGSTTPAQPKIAMPTNDKLTVNGTAADPTVYKIDGSNYFQIRDVAAVLNGTEKQFAVGYSDGKVTVTSGQPYEATGKELAGTPDSAKDASPSNDAIVIDGVETNLTVYKIGGSNYFKLRDLGEALDFYVGWEAGRGVYIETGKPYSK